MCYLAVENAYLLKPQYRKRALNLAKELRIFSDGKFEGY